MTILTRRTSLLAVAGVAGLAASAGVAAAQPNDEGIVGPRVIETPSLAAPIRRDDVLTGYLFITVRTTLAAGVDVWATRERNHFLRDAFVRACYRNRLVDPARPTEIVQPLADNAFRAAAVEVLGARAVHSVVVARFQAMGSRDVRS